MKRRILLGAGGVCGAVLLLLLLAYLIFTGPRDLAQFPPPETSPYRLPWPGGVRYLCVQSVRGIVSHRGRSQFGYDFYMPIGSDISAARAGTVVRVVTHHEGYGRNWPNNLVIVEHEDGTRACYAHIRKDGSYVEEGQRVEQGDILAASGNVGNSMMPHLHFHVTDPALGETIPISFTDISRHRGVPRMFFWYTSGNRPVSVPDGGPSD